MITITVTRRFEQGRFRPTRIRVEGHADNGREQRCIQVCAATSMWNRAFADHLKKVRWIRHGLTDLHLTENTSPAVVRYIVRGYEILANEVAADNVRMQTSWVIPAPRGGFSVKTRKLAATLRKERALRRKAAALGTGAT